MDELLLLSLTILVPALFGIISYLVPGYNLKKYTVILCALVLSVASLLVLYNGPQNVAVDTINAGVSVPVSSIILLLDVLLLLVFIYYGMKDRSWLIMGLAVVQLALLAYLEFAARGGEGTGASFVVDDLSIVMCLIVSIIGSLILIYSIGYMKGDQRVSSFFLVMMLFLGDMNALIFANDLKWLFFFWEGTTLCSFLLIRHYRDEASIKASDRALWMNLLGGVALVGGVILVEAFFGTRFLSDLAGATATLPGGLSLPAATAVLPFALMAFGGFTKSALMPFNSWLTGAMVAPTPVSALLHSSTMVNAGVYVLIRLAPVLLTQNGGVVPALSTIISVAGGFSFMFCAMLAISQTDAKRILAYSTISYLGLIAMCTGINTGLALTAAVALLVFHAVSKGLLFLCVGEIAHITGSRDIDEMQGLIARAPLVAVITVVGLISLMAPPFGIFVGKWLAFQSASTFGTIGLTLLDIFFIVFGSIFSVFYYSRWAGKLLATRPAEAPPKARHDWYMEVPLLVLLAGVFVSVALTTIFFSQLINLDPIYGIEPSKLVFGDVLKSTIGGFSPLMFLIIFLIILLVPILAIRVPKTALTPTYSCGTGKEPDIGGGYFETMIGETRLLKYLYPLGILLLVVLFVAVFL